MTIRGLIAIDHSLFVALLIIYVLHGLVYFWILFSYLANRAKGLSEERRLLALPMLSDDALPDVLVQIPTFNEGRLTGRIAAAVQKLDWPPNKLHVQILDDSSNIDDARYAQQAATQLKSNGVNAALVHRETRTGFKAGAMANGLRQSSEPYVAIFDADYIPSPDFLRCCMRPFLHDDRLALVQARCDYLNASENALTFAQSRILDAHYAVEQAARCWSGALMPFNGTCGIWRRAAIDDAGGWQGDTLAEDMDVSYRAQLKGWHTLLLTSVSVPGELPTCFAALRAQQTRWIKGSAEVSNKLLSSLWQARFSPRQKFETTLYMSGVWLGPLFPITLAVCLTDLAFGPGITKTVALLLAAIAIGVIGGPAALQLVGQRVTRGASLSGEALYLPLVTAIRLTAGIASLGGSIEAMLGRKTSFVRTPKSAA